MKKERRKYKIKKILEEWGFSICCQVYTYSVYVRKRSAFTFLCVCTIPFVISFSAQKLQPTKRCLLIYCKDKRLQQCSTQEANAVVQKLTHPKSGLCNFCLQSLWGLDRDEGEGRGWPNYSKNNSMASVCSCISKPLFAVASQIHSNILFSFFFPEIFWVVFGNRESEGKEWKWAVKGQISNFFLSPYFHSSFITISDRLESVVPGGERHPFPIIYPEFPSYQTEKNINLLITFLPPFSFLISPQPNRLLGLGFESPNLRLQLQQY